MTAPQMKKASDDAAKPTSEADRNHRKEERSMSSTPQTAPAGHPVMIDAEYVADVTRSAQVYGLSFTVESTSEGTAYRLHGVLGEPIAWTYDLDELNTAMLNYWPTITVGSIATRHGSARVDASPAYADESASVFIDGQVAGDGLTLDEATVLAHLLLAAVGEARAA